MMEPEIYLEFADGSRIDGQAGYASGQLWLYLPGVSLPEAAQIIFNEEKTRAIIFHIAKQKIMYRGFRVEALIQDVRETKIRLSGGTVEEETEDEGNLDETGTDGVSGSDGSAAGNLPSE